LEELVEEVRALIRGIEEPPLTFDISTVDPAIQTSLAQPSANPYIIWGERLIKEGSDHDEKQ
jgi:hypothetical protein